MRDKIEQFREEHIPRTDTVQRPYLDRLIQEQMLCDVFTQHHGKITGHLQYYTISYLLILPINQTVSTQVFKADINNIRPQRPFTQPMEQPIKNPPRWRRGHRGK